MRGHQRCWGHQGHEGTSRRWGHLRREGPSRILGPPGTWRDGDRRVTPMTRRGRGDPGRGRLATGEDSEDAWELQGRAGGHGVTRLGTVPAGGPARAAGGGGEGDAGVQGAAVPVLPALPREPPGEDAAGRGPRPSPGHQEQPPAPHRAHGGEGHRPGVALVVPEAPGGSPGWPVRRRGHGVQLLANQDGGLHPIEKVEVGHGVPKVSHWS